MPPSKVGISNYDQLVGDYKNPILQPWAAAIVKRYGEMSLAGITFPNPSSQCWPFPMLFIYKQATMQMIQQPGRITILYSGNSEVRRVRLNEPHPSPLTPSWYGDSVGHYEGDTLVVDTAGVKTDRPYAMIDLFGTPYTEKLHVIERYRLRDYEDVKDALDRNRKENWLFNGDVFARYRGKFLQLHLTVEDEGVFTTPWTATLTYMPGGSQVGEGVVPKIATSTTTTKSRTSQKPRSPISSTYSGKHARPKVGVTFPGSGPESSGPGRRGSDHCSGQTSYASWDRRPDAPRPARSSPSRERRTCPQTPA